MQSGSTGRPKGVVMTHGQTVRQFREWCRFAGLEPGDVLVAIEGRPVASPLDWEVGLLDAGVGAEIGHEKRVVRIAVGEEDVPGVVLVVADELDGGLDLVVQQPERRRIWPWLVGAGGVVVVGVITAVIVVAAGAGYVVPMLGEILRMPGLPKVPRSKTMDVQDGEIVFK